MKIKEFKSGYKTQTGLTVIKELSRNKHGKRVFEFLCLCGKIFATVGGDVAQSKISSCGCFKRFYLAATYSKSKEEKEPAARKMLMWSYKLNCAKNRNLIFTLTEDQFRKLTTMACFYCGTPPLNIYRKERNRRVVRSGGNIVISGYSVSCVYNGIDRLDNSEGYTWENCVAACKICNTAKSNLSVNAFLSWIKRIKNNENVQSLLHLREEQFNLIRSQRVAGDGRRPE